MRKLAFIFCIILILSFCSIAYAEETDAAPEPQTGPGVTYAESPEYSAPAARAAGTISSWTNSIAETSSTTVSCRSYTSASALSDKISVHYILYKYDGGWKQYKSGTHSKTLAAAFTDAIPFVVDPGHSYYVKTYHRTYSGSTCISTKTAASGSIYVS